MTAIDRNYDDPGVAQKDKIEILEALLKKRTDNVANYTAEIGLLRDAVAANTKEIGYLRRAVACLVAAQKTGALADEFMVLANECHE